MKVLFEIQFYSMGDLTLIPNDDGGLMERTDFVRFLEWVEEDDDRDEMLAKIRCMKRIAK